MTHEEASSRFRFWGAGSAWFAFLAIVSAHRGDTLPEVVWVALAIFFWCWAYRYISLRERIERSVYERQQEAI